MRAAAACLRISPQANANENPVHLEDEVVPVEEHEDRRWEEEIP
jgi:hypothetical protein